MPNGGNYMKLIREMNLKEVYSELLLDKKYDLKLIYKDFNISELYDRARELYKTETGNENISDKELEKWLHDKCCYEVLSDLLWLMVTKLKDSDNYKDEFMFYNFHVIMDMMNEFLIDCQVDEQYDIKNLTSLTEDEINRYICEILKEIDPSIEWLNIYLKAKKEGKIININNYSKEELEKLRVKLKLDKIPSGSNCVVIDDETYYLFLTLNSTLYDIISTIHELIHFIITDNNIYLPPILSEFFSIFYEIYAVSYLHKQGFDINELFTIYQKIRIIDLSLISLTLAPLYNYLKVLAERRKISLDDDIKYYVERLKSLKRINKLPIKYSKIQPIDLAFEKCDKYIEFLLDDEFYNLYPYVVGSGLAFEAMKKYDKNLLNKIRGFVNPTSCVDPYEVFSICGFIEEDLIRVGEGLKEFQKEKRP